MNQNPEDYVTYLKPIILGEGVTAKPSTMKAIEDLRLEFLVYNPEGLLQGGMNYQKLSTAHNDPYYLTAKLIYSEAGKIMGELLKESDEYGEILLKYDLDYYLGWNWNVKCEYEQIEPIEYRESF